MIPIFRVDRRPSGARDDAVRGARRPAEHTLTFDDLLAYPEDVVCYTRADGTRMLALVDHSRCRDLRSTTEGQ